MRSRVVLALLIGVLMGACGEGEPAMPAACLATDAAGYERALRSAPDAVRLPGDVAISTCLQRVRSDAELQALGAVVHRAGEELARRARHGDDRDAAIALGYLAAAAAVGAARSNGISAELARRVALTSGAVERDTPVLAGAVRAGAASGRVRG